MSIIRKLQEKWRNARISRSIGASIPATPLSPPQIFTEYGAVTESARRQAAINIKLDPIIRSAVEALLTRKLGSEEAMQREMRRRYPEVFEDESKEAS